MQVESGAGWGGCLRKFVLPQEKHTAKEDPTQGDVGETGECGRRLILWDNSTPVEKNMTWQVYLQKLWLNMKDKMFFD